MRRIRNVAFALLVLGSLAEYASADLRADFYFANCGSVTYFGIAGANAEGCEDNCGSLDADCAAYCAGQYSYCGTYDASCYDGTFVYCFCDWGCY